MVNGVTKARWFRLYSISKDAINILMDKLGESMSVKISKEVEFNIEDVDGNKIDPKIETKGIDLLEKITQQQYMRDYLKMSDYDIEELTTRIIKRVDPQISVDKLSKLKSAYLSEKTSVSDTFYLLQDETLKSILLIPDNSVNRIVDKISEKSIETPSVFDLPDGPEFLLWLFYKYWKKANISGINITNVSSVSNIEENNNHVYSHRANGDAERDSLEICFKIMLNKAITSLRFQLNLNNKFGIEIEIQIPERRKSPKSFKFSIPNDPIILPSELLAEISNLRETEKLVLKKAIGAYLFYSILFPPLISEYKKEEKTWKNGNNKTFINEIYNYAMSKIRDH